MVIAIAMVIAMVIVVVSTVTVVSIAMDMVVVRVIRVVRVVRVVRVSIPAFVSPHRRSPHKQFFGTIFAVGRHINIVTADQILSRIFNILINPPCGDLKNAI